MGLGGWLRRAVAVWVGCELELGFGVKEKRGLSYCKRAWDTFARKKKWCKKS